MSDHQPPSPSTEPNRLPVHTHHCRFCSHLILSTTRTITSLPRRKEPAKDSALILPLPTDNDVEDEEELAQAGGGGDGKRTQKHYTILLSTTIPDRKMTLIRREDGFEKRLFLRCGRCRVVVGYFLDPVHFPKDSAAAAAATEEDGDLGANDKAKVVYILPGALMETEDMGDEDKMRGMDREWNGWAS